jgi:beta-glucosidase
MLHEYWLPHFQEAIVEGHAESVMASYNAINGTHNNINHWLLTDVLKNEWHHDGFVVSDLGGVGSVAADRGARLTVVDAVAQSLMAGCDFSDREFQANIPAAVQAGKLTLERLNDAVTRVMRVRMKLGEFDPFESGPYSKISPAVIDSAAHRDLALLVAQQSIVLLQNHGGLLPLDQTKLKRIAVLGPLADQIETNNYNGKYSTAVSPLQGLKDRAGPGSTIVSAVGASLAGTADAPAADLAAAVALAHDADAAVVFVGTNRTIEQENHDRRSLGLPGNQEALVKAIVAANPRTVVVLMGAGPLTVPWLKDNVPAMLQAWWPGEEGGHAVADVLLGEVNPAGRLPHTVYASEAQVPPTSEYDITKGFTYMYVNGPPLFPFGHGLSYTTFGYDALKLSDGAIKADGTLTVSVDVTNTGARAGDEVVQLYAHQLKSSVKVPVAELRGFQRVSLRPGEKRTVTFTLPGGKLAIWDEKTHGFVVEPGAFEVMVGASSGDLRLRQGFNVAPN